ncbi:MAG: hypothetical protein H6557_31345 [Lewinellaceae bacterium]|nr:hypothetical protein [Phaeodactylibacter sp.]MCB9041143.1 hypothetical protein [Lewinellaceae bacterium]
MKRLLGIGLLLALLGLGVGYFMYNKPHQNMDKAKVDVALEASELFTAFETNEAEANEKYLDKIIKVSGTVKEVSTDDKGNISVTLESGSEMFGVVCQMDDLTKHAKTNFEPGEQITFKGVCTGMLMDVVLVRCVVA